MPINPLAMKGRAILVTGASSGIGQETAILLSELEADVVISGRNQQRLQETRARMSGSNHQIEVFDLDDADAIPSWLKRITAKTGPLYGLVHSAGIQKTVPLRVLSVKTIDALFRTNVTSAIMLIAGFRQRGCSVKGGSAVLISSVAGVVGQPAITAYSASKAALIGFVKSAAMELASEGLRINCVAPGYVHTEMSATFQKLLTPEQMDAIAQMHPLGMGRPLDVAQAIAYLLADTGRWITGSTLVVDGGYTAR